VASSDRPKLDADTWRAWLAVRDACPVGREHRYGDDQIAYHYAKRRDALG
jgi:cyanocobalamin reductase (cyanide-eliminating) / alkylcobalamin dealkylase